MTIHIYAVGLGFVVSDLGESFQKKSQIAAPFSVGHFAVWVFSYRTYNRLSWCHSWMPSGQLLILQLTLMPVRMPLLP